MNIQNTLFIITGTTQGLGYDIFSEILKITDNITTINRSPFSYTNNIIFDFHDYENIEDSLFFKMKKTINKYNYIVLILNASMIDPIKKVGHYENSDVTKIINTNIISQVLLTNFIIKQNKKGIAINITSGSAHIALEGLGLYSLSKSAMYKFFEISDIEKTMMKFINFDPGNMNTQMQEKIRHEDSHFELTYKKHLQIQHKNGDIKTSEKSAQRLVDELVKQMEEI